MTGDATTLEQRVQRLAERTVALCTDRTGDLRSLEALQLLKGRWQTGAVPCVVAGEVSSGKSTLINALVGRELLPHDGAACTATRVRVHHAEAPVAAAHLRTSDVPQPGKSPNAPDTTSVIDVGELGTYLAVAGAKALRRKHGPRAVVVSVDVGVPAPLLEGGLELLDTPGVNGLDEAHLAAARTGLVRADALIYVVKPGNGISASARVFLAEASHRVSTCVLVHTHRDRLADPDASLATDLETLLDAAQWRSLLGDEAKANEIVERMRGVVGVSVSSTNWLKALDRAPGERRTALEHASGIPVLAQILRQDVAQVAAATHCRNIARLCALLNQDTRARAEADKRLLAGDEQAAAELADRDALIAQWTANNGDHWRRDFLLARDAIAQDLKDTAAARSAELNRRYRATLQTSGRAKQREILDGLADAPGILLVDLLDQSSEGLNDAMARVRDLLALNDLDGPLRRLMAAGKVRLSIPDTPKLDVNTTPGPAELRAAFLGGMTGAGAAGLAVPALVKAGFLTMAIAPVLVPAIVGAAVFGGLQWGQNNRARAAVDSVVHLDELRTCLTGPVVDEAVVVLRSVAATLATQIEESILELRVDVATKRKTLREASRLHNDPAARAQRTAELDDVIARASVLVAEADELA